MGAEPGRRARTEPSNASRTMLFDIDRGAGPTSCSSLRAASCLPDVRPSSGRWDHRFDHARPAQPVRASPAISRPRCWPGLLLPRHDQEHLRHRLVRARQPGRLAPAPVDGLLTTVAWQLGEATTYAMEGSIFVTGAAVHGRATARHHRGVVGSRTSRERARPRRSCSSPRSRASARRTSIHTRAVFGLTRRRRAPVRVVVEAMAWQTADGDRRHHRGSRNHAHRAAADARQRAMDVLRQFQADAGSRCRRDGGHRDHGARRRLLAGSPKVCGRHRPKRRRRGGGRRVPPRPAPRFQRTAG